MGIFDQAEFEIRCEWGCEGITRLASISDVIIIVDILSFSTSVEIAVSRGAIIFPYRYKDDSALSYASSIGADLAGNRRDGCKYSLSPKSLSGVSSNQRLVLPSPNGATLSLETRKVPTIAGCLRNASSVAKAAGKLGKRIAVIPAGEKWEETGSLRPCLEDLIGAGAIISALAGHLDASFPQQTYLLYFSTQHSKGNSRNILLPFWLGSRSKDDHRYLLWQLDRDA